MDLMSDAKDSPTVLASGSLRFFVIERAGNVGVRVRDVESPRKKNFLGLEYFPIDPQWAFDARFEPYEPKRHIKIVNILGMEEEMESPGAVVFTKGGQEWRLDAVLGEPDAKELFVMFADGTSGRETYGAGRFMYISFPTGGRAVVDFNKAYNPPCAFTPYATCPLPPKQNYLPIAIRAGAMTYPQPGASH
jgi:uncharacterized protein (DUF1684 family)